MSSPMLPYNPTKAFLSPVHPIIYVFTNANSPTSGSELLTLDVSSVVQSSSLSFETVTPNLPFINDAEDAVAFVPAITSSGTIGVYSGNCTSSSTLWQFQPSNATATSGNGTNGTWSQLSISTSSASSNVIGAHYLASAFYFSTLVNTEDSQRTVYSFGGMCPTNSNSNITSWQSMATYSNRMTKLTPSSSTAYQASLSVTTGNGPIPEAGFTITGVLPTISNSSTGIVTQAQNFVLIGGHTQTAFINMSQVAIFSLPQESWAFQTIDPEASTGNTELAIKSTTSTPSTQSQTIPDSRSGHSATLSADGSHIIIFGGWVGDINTPADPQLAILQLGSGFGGSGSWSWSMPNASGTGLQSGEGIYGHDAVMLPGNVMMVVGGFTISSSSTKSKRDSSPQQALFLNTTSMTWQSSYTNPSHLADTASSSAPSSSTNAALNRSKQIGLGAGLGLGFAAIIGAIAFYFWYSKKLKRKREEAREKDLQRLNRTASNGNDTWWNSRNPEMVQREGLISSPYGNSSYSGYGDDNINGNSPTLIPRKPLNQRAARNYYTPSPIPPSISRTNSLGTAGIIHPIYEADEDNDPNDPFRDPSPNKKQNPLRSHPLLQNSSVSERNTPSPESPLHEPDHSIKEWAADWAAADALMNPNHPNAHSRNHSWTGRTSPSKESSSGRTTSNLSEHSAASASATAISRDSSTRTRSNSLTAFLAAGGAAGWNPFNSNGLGQIDERNNTGWGASSASDPVLRPPNIGRRASPGSDRALRPPNSSGSGSSGSYITAQTSSSSGYQNHNHNQYQTTAGVAGRGFNVLRSEGETLLGGRQNPYIKGSPSKRKPRHGWLGSLKRVFVGEEWVSSDGSESPSPTRATFEYHNSPLSISANGSPSRPSYEPDVGNPNEPRRTVSASATLWRRKQGRGDWEDSADPNERKRSSTMTIDAERLRDGLMEASDGGLKADGRIDDDDDDWDIEKAIERRMVQVMFTVPRGNLRVVNQDIEEDEESNVDSGPSAHNESSTTITSSIKQDEPMVKQPSSTSPLTSGLKGQGTESTGEDPGANEGMVDGVEEKFKSSTSPYPSTDKDLRRLRHAVASDGSFSAERHHPLKDGVASPIPPPEMLLKSSSITCNTAPAVGSKWLRQHATSGNAISASPASKGSGNLGERKCSVDLEHHEPSTSGRALSPASQDAPIEPYSVRTRAPSWDRAGTPTSIRELERPRSGTPTGPREMPRTNIPSRDRDKGKGRVQELVEKIDSPRF